MRLLLALVIGLVAPAGSAAGGDRVQTGPESGGDAAKSGPSSGVDRGSPGAPESDECAETIAGRVQAHYQGVRDLHARFAQTQHSVAFGGAADQPTRGEVWFAKPGRMRWSYEEPEPSLVVSDGATLWIYDPGAREVQVLPVDRAFLSGAAIQFLLGEGRILESFRVSAETCAGESVELALVPRAESTYERLVLQVRTDSGAVQGTEVFDLFGNRTRVRFEQVETNREPPEGLFRFEAPEGVRVLSLESP
jgi:outer membrane lipoprotein carrier protein